MSNDNSAEKLPDNPVNLLQEAIREVRVASAERAESIANTAEIARLKLEMLFEKLEESFSEAETYPDLFDTAISSGQSPKLFIDATTHVALARDQKTFRLIRATRKGRLVLEENEDADILAKAVTRYMAERIVERDTLLNAPEQTNQTTDQSNKEPTQMPVEGPWADFFLGLIWFVIGVCVGAALLYMWANGWFGDPTPVVTDTEILTPETDG